MRRRASIASRAEESVRRRAFWSSASTSALNFVICLCVARVRREQTPKVKTHCGAIAGRRALKMYF
jgi:hypothetical protein